MSILSGIFQTHPAPKQSILPQFQTISNACQKCLSWFLVRRQMAKNLIWLDCNADCKIDFDPWNVYAGTVIDLQFNCMQMLWPVYNTVIISDEGFTFKIYFTLHSQKYW